MPLGSPSVLQVGRRRRSKRGRTPGNMDLPGKEFAKMMGCLPGRRKLWAGVATALLAVAGGCVENDSLTLLNPEGPPVVTGAFVDVDDDPTYDINAAYAELYAGHALTYGSHK